MVGRRVDARARRRRARSRRVGRRADDARRSVRIERGGVHDGRARVGARDGSRARARRRGAPARRASARVRDFRRRRRQIRVTPSSSFVDRFHFSVSYSYTRSRSRRRRARVRDGSRSRRRRRRSARSLVNLRLREQHVPSNLRARDVPRFAASSSVTALHGSRVRVATPSRRRRTLGSYLTNSSFLGVFFGFLRLT